MLRPLLCTLAALALLACDDRGSTSDPVNTWDARPGEDATSGDAIPPEDDAALPHDDAALPHDDAALPGDDAALPGDDAALPGDDAALPGDDAALPDDDATLPDLDAETPPDPDAETPPDPDAETPPDPDAEVPFQCDDLSDSLLADPGFETWAEDWPTEWQGEATNLEIIARGAPHCGRASARLINESETHKRLSSTPFAAQAGRYTCTFFVRGQGQIRNAVVVDGDFSNYEPSSYWTLDEADFTELTYRFFLERDAAAVELVFSVRNTAGLEVDDVLCQREADPCDVVTCGDWATCRAGVCEPDFGRCDVAADCQDWQTCDATHTCVAQAGRCGAQTDCDGESGQICDLDAHACIAGDPCEGVTCQEWEACSPATGRCGLAEGRCRTTNDCLGALPACDPTTRTCVSAEHPANIVPNGGFEAWDVYEVPYHGENLLPDFWYGLDFGNDDTGFTEIDPTDLHQVIEGQRSGASALRIVGGDIADRFTSEGFSVPAGTYTCAYWAKGEGGIRHRTYSSAGWSPETPRVDLNTADWQRFSFDIRSNAREMRIIFYASRTVAASGDLQLDDVVCTRNP